MKYIALTLTSFLLLVNTSFAFATDKDEGDAKSYLAESDSTKSDKFLYYQFASNVVISISNIPCPMKQYAKALPWIAVAYRADGAVLTGCYGPETADLIRIQWAPINGAESDFTILPANVFLMQPPESFEQYKHKDKAILKKELDV